MTSKLTQQELTLFKELTPEIFEDELFVPTFVGRVEWIAGEDRDDEKQDAKKDILESDLYKLFSIDYSDILDFVKTHCNIEEFKTFADRVIKKESRKDEKLTSIKECKKVCEIYDKFECATKAELLYVIVQMENYTGLDCSMLDLIFNYSEEEHYQVEEEVERRTCKKCHNDFAPVDDDDIVCFRCYDDSSSDSD